MRSKFFIALLAKQVIWLAHVITSLHSKIFYIMFQHSIFMPFQVFSSILCSLQKEKNFGILHVIQDKLKLLTFQRIYMSCQTNEFSTKRGWEKLLWLLRFGGILSSDACAQLSKTAWWYSVVHIMWLCRVFYTIPLLCDSFAAQLHTLLSL